MMNVEKQRILVVDDELQITRTLKVSLIAHGYEVRTAGDADSAFDSFGDFRPDLVITDLQMPFTDGIELCRRIRQVSHVPIIVLTVKGDEKTKVEALDAGADDYMTKPFGIDELTARIRAIMRRASYPIESQTESRLEVGDFTVDLERHAIAVRGRELQLTPKEFELLAYMIRNHSKVITHRAILSAVWGPNSVEQSEYLRVFLGNLRKKVEADPADPKYILTKRWIGYKLDPQG